MIRIIAREEDNRNCAAGVGATETSYKTFDFPAPELEQWIRSAPEYVRRSFIGVTVVLEEKLKCQS